MPNDKKKNSPFRSIFRIVYAGLTFTGLVTLTLSSPIAQAEPRTISIPAQPLAFALDSLDTQAKIKVHYSQETVGGKRVPDIKGEFSPTRSFSDLQKTTINDEKFSPRWGLLYKLIPWVSLYGNYTEALSGNAGQLANGAPMHAQRSRSYETGAKTETFDGRLISTLAFFEIFKSNLSTQNLAAFNPVDGVGIGEARSRGVELDITGQVTRDLNIIATYAYTDARISKDTSGLGLIGHRLTNIPVYSGSLWARYQVSSGFSVGAGAYYRGDRFGNNENNFALPAYTCVDMFAAYMHKVGQSRLATQLNTNNSLNARYCMNSNVLNEGGIRVRA